MTEGNGEVRKLPKGWAIEKLKFFYEVIGGGTPSTKIDNYWDGEIPWITSADIEDLERIRIRKFITKEAIENSATNLVPKGTIIVVTRVGLGKIALADRELCFSQDNQGLVDLTNGKNIYDKYALYYLSVIVQNFKYRNQGTTISGVTKKHLAELNIFLPPFKEQKRIVGKIEELFSELDQGIESLKTAQKQLKVYRQAVLKWAFGGKLTEEWRKQHSSTLKTGEALLAQIKAERENRYQQQLAEWEEKVREWEAIGKVGKKPTKPQKSKELSPLSEVELNELPKLPNVWDWVKLGEITEEPKYGTSKKCTYETVGKGVLRIPNIGDGVINKSDLKFAEFEEDEIQTWQLREGDLLTIRSNGSVSLVGKCALVSNFDKEFLFAGYLIRIRPYSNLIISKYLLNCLGGTLLRNQIESKAKSTSGVNNINSDEIKGLRIPYCSIEEQEQIVQEIESRLSICDQLEVTIIENLQKAEALRQSILKQAFEGKLVPQDPNDEPAEKLLERIKAERQVNGNTGKKSKPSHQQLTLQEL